MSPHEHGGNSHVGHAGHPHDEHPGPEGLLKDPSITDILVNRFDRIYVERRGRLEMVDVRFRDNAHLRQIIDRIVGRIGRRIDETSPMVDARLADGSRVNAIIPPLSLDGPAMSVRRFGAKPLQLEDLIRHGAFPPAVIEMCFSLAARSTKPATRDFCALEISGPISFSSSLLRLYLISLMALERSTTRFS